MHQQLGICWDRTACPPFLAFAGITLSVLLILTMDGKAHGAMPSAKGCRESYKTTGKKMKKKAACAVEEGQQEIQATPQEGSSYDKYFELFAKGRSMGLEKDTIMQLLKYQEKQKNQDRATQ
jgi:hypothetical protein